MLEQQLAGARRANPELVFLLADREAGHAALDDERGDPAVARLRVEVREDDEEVRFVGVGDPELAAVEPVVVAVLPRPCLERERVAARTGLRQRVRADARGRQLRQHARFQVRAAPAQQRVGDERVLHVHQDADRRIDARELLDREDRVEEPAAAAAERFGDFDAHHAEIEQLVDQRPRDLRLLVHFADERPYLRVREFADAVAEQPLVFGERGERMRSRVGGQGGHRPNVIIEVGTPSADVTRSLSRAIVVLVLVTSATVLTQEPPRQDPPPQPAQQPTFRARVDSVSVDVIVLDRAGKPVTDLKQEEFEIRESNKVQKIETFKLVQTDDGRDGPPLRDILSIQDQQREAANDQNRLFAIFLDDYHVRRTNSLRAREQLSRFVSELSPRDLVAVSYPLTPAGALTFSRNHDGTAAAIANFEGRKYDYTPRNPFEERYQLQPPELLERMRNELTISGLENLCTFMGSMREGRKTILFVSEGLSGTLPVGVRTTGNLVGSSPVPQSSSQAFFNSADLLGQFRMLFVAASRANTSVYTFDPRGLATGEFDLADRVASEADRQVLTESLDSLRIIADNTDGRAIVNRNDPAPDLKRMVQDNSAYYLLGYTTTAAPRDGKFHEIQVRVKRRDVDVRARKGYWAYTAEDAERASAPSKPAAPRDVVAALDDLAGVVEPTGRSPVVLWLGATRGPDADGKAVVTFAWEPSPGTPDPGEVVDRVNVTVNSIHGDLLFKGSRGERSAGPASGRDGDIPGAAGRSACAGDCRKRQGHASRDR